MHIFQMWFYDKVAIFEIEFRIGSVMHFIDKFIIFKG